MTHRELVERLESVIAELRSPVGSGGFTRHGSLAITHLEDAIMRIRRDRDEREAGGDASLAEDVESAVRVAECPAILLDPVSGRRFRREELGELLAAEAVASVRLDGETQAL